MINFIIIVVKTKNLAASKISYKDKINVDLIIPGK